MFDKIYKKVWKKIIKPDRIDYSKDDLGPTQEFFDDNWHSFREDFVVKNNLKNNIEVSIYWPRKNESNVQILNQEEEITEQVQNGQQEEEITESVQTVQQEEITESIQNENYEVHYEELINCVIYCHSHNSCRIQGTWLKEYLIPNNVALCIFDFKGSGHSEGDYTTMGWHETFDIDAVVRKLMDTKKINKVSLWGRSMGAAAILFYTSSKFRFEIERQISITRNSTNKMFHDTEAIASIIVDSPFDNQCKSIKYLINNSNSYVPNFAISLAIDILNSTVKEKALFDLKQANPSEYVGQCSVPAYFIVSDEDQFIAPESFDSMFQNYAGYKKCIICEGDHATSRNDEDTKKLVDFIFASFDETLRSGWNRENKNFRMSTRRDPESSTGDNVPVEGDNDYKNSDSTTQNQDLQGSMSYLGPNKILLDSMLLEDRPKIFAEYKEPNAKSDAFMKELDELFGNESIIQGINQNDSKLFNTNSTFNMSESKKIFGDYQSPSTDTFRSQVDSMFDSATFDKENASFFFDKDEPVTQPTEIQMKKVESITIVDKLQFEPKKNTEELHEVIDLEQDSVNLQKNDSSELNNAIMVSNIENQFKEIEGKNELSEAPYISENLIKSDVVNLETLEADKNLLETDNRLNEITETKELILTDIQKEQSDKSNQEAENLLENDVNENDLSFGEVLDNQNLVDYDIEAEKVTKKPSCINKQPLLTNADNQDTLLQDAMLNWQSTLDNLRDSQKAQMDDDPEENLHFSIGFTNNTLKAFDKVKNYKKELSEIKTDRDLKKKDTIQTEYFTPNEKPNRDYDDETDKVEKVQPFELTDEIDKKGEIEEDGDISFLEKLDTENDCSFDEAIKYSENIEKNDEDMKICQKDNIDLQENELERLSDNELNIIQEDTDLKKEESEKNLVEGDLEEALKSYGLEKNQD